MIAYRRETILWGLLTLGGFVVLPWERVGKAFLALSWPRTGLGQIPSHWPLALVGLAASLAILLAIWGGGSQQTGCLILALATLGALAGLTSVMLVMLLGQTRVLYAMANDGLLPKGFFAAVHPKFRTPYKNTVLVGFLAAIVGSVTPIDDIGKMVNIGTLLAFVMVCTAVMILRTINPSQPRPFRTPWVPVVPVLGILFNGYMMYKLGWINWARLIGWLIIGLVIYFSYSRYHSRVSNTSQQ